VAGERLPLLSLDAPTVRQRPAGPRRAVPRPQHPTRQRQAERLDHAFQDLLQAFSERLIQIQDVPAAEAAEQVLVLETIGDVRDLEAAVRRLEGFEWLFDAEDRVDADEDFFYADRREKPVERRLFLVSSNEAAIRQLLQLWETYKRNPAEIRRNFRKWVTVFDQLRTLRYWDERDRLTQEALDYWRDELVANPTVVQFEIEMWFSQAAGRNAATAVQLASLVEAAGGRVITGAEIAEIRYHAALVELPGGVVQRILDGNYPQLVLYQRVMFFQPMVRGMSRIDVSDAAFGEHPVEPTEAAPIVALLDGLPLQNHALLAGRLLIDDPDGWEPAYAASARKHGTAMASLIVHGDLGHGEAPTRSRIYVRPVLRPDANGDERTPDDVLLVDLIHRAVRRLFDGEGAQAAVAPTVRVINLSIGDEHRLFSRQISPWARLLDWLSWKYGVLFCVSAGNDDHPLTLGVLRRDFPGLTHDDLQREVLGTMLGTANVRVMLNPAESINAVTVGAAFADGSAWTPVPGVKEVFSAPLPAPYSRCGLGYARAVKPDVLFPGGRRGYRERLGAARDPAILEPVRGTGHPPGQKAAVPGPAGQTNATAFLAGTSNATALATRHFTRLWDAIEGNQATASLLGNRQQAASLIKALLVHGAKWGDFVELVDRLVTEENHYQKKDAIAALTGFGLVDPERGLSCPAERATLVAANSIRVDEIHEYRVPLPPGLANVREWKRLTVSLAWLTPTVSSRRAYRSVRMAVKIPDGALALSREDASHVAVDRGTVQHEVFEGSKAVAFVDGDAMVFAVECRSAAETPNDPIPYGLCISLEVAQGVQIAVYNEIRARVRQAVSIVA